MERRNFLKSAAALSTLGLVSPVFSESKQVAQPAVVSSGKARRFVMTQTYSLKAPKGSEGLVNLWIPVPEDTAFQQLLDLSFSGNYQKATLNANNRYGAKMLFVTWADSKGALDIKVEMTIETRDWEVLKENKLADWQLPESDAVIPDEIKPFLQPTAHIPVDGLVKETALKIIGKEKAPIKQARLIHDWVSTHMHRDDAVIGCGTGDVGEILKTNKLGGKCTDINSVFVALCRAVGIPAREMFGIRLGSTIKLDSYSKKAFGSADAQGVAKVSGGQHCRAMFWLAGFGWVPADPADVTKMRLTEKKENGDPAVKAVNDYLFGNWEMNWVGFNHARDFALFPASEQGDINNLGYPYAEVDGDPLNFYDPALFSYDYVSVEQH
ncbi:MULTISPECIES: transglutaminase-like domain-containing protein [unclassified Pseudocitrobacter]|uniref:transglutaminase-like domain-containing protein n=1 Tax=unclassified Pseudocitrobacter TaxID=2638778 RepID=UPI0023E3731C|nr:MULTISPECIES: transglutaminase family protein [unclassified Pseudocitrobacter]MDF3828989.1 transglutaminase family protein [Pseudocitrobacter sp. 2023EL-00150]MEC5374768.1 transglutaminase family protein [Pseudocitrobacter sp. MW920760]